jgi:hypothetical protein
MQTPAKSKLEGQLDRHSGHGNARQLNSPLPNLRPSTGDYGAELCRYATLFLSVTENASCMPVSERSLRLITDSRHTVQQGWEVHAYAPCSCACRRPLKGLFVYRCGYGRVAVCDDHLGRVINRVSRSCFEKSPTLQGKSNGEYTLFAPFTHLGTRDAIAYRVPLQQFPENGLRPTTKSTRSSEHPAPKVRRRLDSDLASWISQTWPHLGAIPL